MLLIGASAGNYIYVTTQKTNDRLPITRVCFRAGKRVEETFPKYEMLSTHAGRRTFICLALSSGIPPQVVMKWTIRFAKPLTPRLSGDRAIERETAHIHIHRQPRYRCVEESKSP